MHRQHPRRNFCASWKFRGKDPLYRLSTDIICGFVGETDDDFRQTLKIVREARFDSAFMFIWVRVPHGIRAQKRKLSHRNRNWNATDASWNFRTR